MKHAREDYNRIQDPAGKIPEDEPVFLLRAQDELACIAVAFYADLCAKHQSPEVAVKAYEHAHKMRAWPVKKVPDFPPNTCEQEEAPTSPCPVTGNARCSEQYCKGGRCYLRDNVGVTARRYG